MIFSRRYKYQSNGTLDTKIVQVVWGNFVQKRLPEIILGFPLLERTTGVNSGISTEKWIFYSDIMLYSVVYANVDNLNILEEGNIIQPT